MEQSVREELRRWWAVLWAHAHAGTLPAAPSGGQSVTLSHRDGKTTGESLEPRVVVVPVLPAIEHVSPSNPWPMLGGVTTAEPQVGPAVSWAERASTPATAAPDGEDAPAPHSIGQCP